MILNGIPHYKITWATTWEPITNLPKSLIEKFEGINPINLKD